MMLVPIDADAAVVQPLVSSVERNVLTDAFLVLGDKMLYSSEGRLFFNGEHKDKVRLRFDTGFIKRANRSQDRFDVASVIAYSGSEDLAVANLGFDLQAFLKD